MAFSGSSIAAALALVASCVAQAQEYVIRTYAGGGPPATPVAGVSASVGDTEGVATDAAGNVYFSSSDNCVFRLDTNGVLTRVAGNSRLGYSGDGGPATSAELQPYGMALDEAGNLYIADGNGRIRKVSPAGIITTVAGNGTYGSSGDGGPAIGAQLADPVGVAVDGTGNLYIADSGSNRIRKVSPAGIITTVAGDGAPGFSGDGGPATSAELYGPLGVVVDADGNMYIADGGNSRIRKVSPAGIINTVAGNGAFGYSGDGGPATSAELKAPHGIAVDGAGDLYIADIYNYRIRKVSPAGIITTAAGNGTYSFSGDGGPASSAQLNGPGAVALDGAGNLYIADGGNDRVRKVSRAGIITTVAGDGVAGYSGDRGPATSAELANAGGLAVDGAGNLYIADGGNQRIRKVSPAGIITTIAGNGVLGFSGDGGPATSARLYYPAGVAVDSAGNLYIADTDNNRIRKVSPAGIITTVAGDGAYGFSGDGGPATSAELNDPGAVVVDGAGNLYIADTGNNRVRQVSAAGIITTIAGDGTPGFSGDGGPATSAQLGGVEYVAVDGAGNLYIAGGSQRIRKVSPVGIITTIAGDGTPGYSGDGGLATSADLYNPAGVAVDSVGRIFIADSVNNAIRQLTPRWLAPIRRRLDLP